MIFLSVVGLIALSAPAQPARQLKLVGSSFELFEGKGREPLFQVPIDAEAGTAKKSVLFRRDTAFAVWDRRGLTVRGTASDRVKAKQLPLAGIAVSPRFRTHEAILATLTAFDQDTLNREPTALSGARRIGKDVYFLVRWESKPGKSWLEALVRVNLASPKPVANALAVLPGVSFSAKPVEDNLQAAGDELRVLTHDGSNWGLWVYNVVSRSGSFRALGSGIKYAKIENSADGTHQSVVYIEKDALGGFTAGRLSLEDGSRSCQAESSSLWRVVTPADGEGAAMDTVATGTDGADEQIALNLVTGAQLVLPSGAELKSTGSGVLVWVGGNHPEKAWLYDATDWEPIAWWRRPGSTSTD